MTTIDIRDVPAALPGRRRLHPARWFRLWRANAREQRRRRRGLQELQRLDDHLLRDIGIDRADLRDALRGRRYSVWLNPVRRPERE